MIPHYHAIYKKIIIQIFDLSLYMQIFLFKFPPPCKSRVMRIYEDDHNLKYAALGSMLRKQSVDCRL